MAHFSRFGQRRSLGLCSTVLVISTLFTNICIAQSGSDRTRIRFDDNWRFLRDAGTDQHTSRGPFSWEWKLAEVTGLDVTELPTDLASGDWKATLLGDYTLSGDQNRFGWYRADIGNGPIGVAKVLEFESVDDNALIFLNGKLLHKQIGYGVPFSVPVRSAWNSSGHNTLVLLVENTGGGGGINGGINLVRRTAESTSPMLGRRFDDSTWRRVHLPHDYGVEGKFTSSGDVGHGSLPKPMGTYRKTFVPPNSMRGKTVWIDFDGIYRNSSIYLNGHKLGNHASGYIGARFDISNQLEFGKSNVIAVSVDPRRDEGWWYEGAGIYRHVWLNAANRVHVAPDGVFARAENVTANFAAVKITTSVKNDSTKSDHAGITVELLRPDGRVSATATSALNIRSHESKQTTYNISVSKPALWDLSHPQLYKVKVTVRSGGHLLDQTITHFGIRDLKWDNNRGFLLNGRVVKLQGTCNHQDHAGVGIAMPDGLQAWRIKKLLEMGSNAYRTSHNPVSPEFLDLCDRMGMLVLDETRHLGDTSLPKTPSGTKADDLSDLKTQILRDRNHPSVIAWSLYNEEGLQGTAEGAEIFKKMRAVVDKLDGTRISTGATNGGYNSGIQLVTKVFGYNYSIGAYDEGHRLYPNQAMFGSETSSAVTTRGEYVTDPVKGYMSAYDVNRPDWGMTAEGAWKPIADRNWMAGAFVWTGFDYKGEPTPYGWPCINSHFGIMDIAGFPKDNFYYYQAVWGKKLMVHVLPHWNWPGKERQPISVWVHSNAKSVTLYLNGKSLGTKLVPHLGHLEWSVPYEPGVLAAIGTRGQEVVKDRVETTGVPLALRLKTDGNKILADSEDLSVVAVEVVDSRGRVVPYASNRVTFRVQGAAAIGGVGNGDPSDHDPDKASNRRAFHGLAMALVQSNGRTGAIRLVATAVGLKPATLLLTAKPMAEK